MLIPNNYSPASTQQMLAQILQTRRAADATDGLAPPVQPAQLLQLPTPDTGSGQGGGGLMGKGYQAPPPAQAAAPTQATPLPLPQTAPSSMFQSMNTVGSQGGDLSAFINYLQSVMGYPNAPKLMQPIINNNPTDGGGG